MLSYKTKLVLQFLSSSLSNLWCSQKTDCSLLRLSGRRRGFGLQWLCRPQCLFSTNAWICQNIKNTITNDCSLATVQTYTFVSFNKTNKYFEFGDSFNFLPFICIIIVQLCFQYNILSSKQDIPHFK